jgi:hypothetical protein
MICKRVMKKLIKKKIFIIFILFNPTVHKINNSCCLSNFEIEIIRDNSKDNGTKREAIVDIFNSEYLKYIVAVYPSSIIRSKKLTALTVQAMAVKVSKIVIKFLKISTVRYL